LELEQVDFESEKLVEEIVDTAAVQTGANEIDLTCFIDPALPPVLKGDPHRIRQIFTNLVSNAVRFTSRGEVGLQVSAAPSDSKGIAVCFAVRDTGPGIPTAAVQGLWAPFTQADSSMTREYGGTGLGLAISQELARLMGGELRVESVVGRGSIFTLSVVLAPGETSEADPPGPADPADLERITLIGPGTPAVRTVAMMLSAWGIEHERSDQPAPTRKAGQTGSSGPSIMILTPDQPGEGAPQPTVGGGIYLRPPVKPSQLRAALLELAAA